MRTPDVNVLIYAVNESAPQHDRAVTWLDDALSGPEIVGFSWFALTGFFRIATNASLPQPLSPSQALAICDAWHGAQPARLIGPGARHFQILQRLMLEHQLGGRAISDVHLAAIAIEHDATLGTFDSDFHRFAGLKLDFLGAR